MEAGVLFTSETLGASRQRRTEPAVLREYEVDDGTGRTVVLRLSDEDAKARGAKLLDEGPSTKVAPAPKNKSREADSKE